MEKIIGALSGLPPTDISPPLPALPKGTAGAGGPAMSDPERAKIKKAATEFESFFLYYMLKTMRQAVPKGGLLESRHSDTYLGLMDQEIANLAAKRGSLGLAQAIEKQMLPPPPPMRLSSSHVEHPIRELEKEGAAHEHIR
jgi:Rod binding domain-containing protein